MNSVTVIDYGIVNLGNIVRALEHVGARVCVGSDPGAVSQADRVILPGVGAFASGMAELKSRDLDNALKEAALAGAVPPHSAHAAKYQVNHVRGLIFQCASVAQIAKKMVGQLVWA